jgi:beta-N-acetylglucosaminidase
MLDEGLDNLVAAGLNMDVRESSEANGADILLYTRGATLNQKFQMRKISTSTFDTYVIEGVKSGKFVTVDSASGTKVYQYQGSGSGTNYQQWKLEPAGEARFRLKNVATGKYLDIGAGTRGTNLSVAASGSFSKQAWSFQATDPLSDGLYTFASALNNKLVFDIAGSSLQPGVSLALWTAHGGSNQVFRVVKLGAKRYSIMNLNSGLALDVEGSSVNATTGAGRVLQYTVTGNANQIWDIQYAGGGGFRFVSALQSGRACLTIGSSSPSNGTAVKLLDKNNAATQAFKPLPAGTISYYQMNCTLDQFTDWQYPEVSRNYPGYSWSTLKTNLDPNSKTGSAFLQFVDVRVGTGLTGAQLNRYIASTSNGRNGIFNGRGQAFVDAANKYGLNEVYFLAHANLESAWGTSNFAKGSYYDGVRKIDGKTYPAGTYYNFWGIGAYDSNPNNAIDYAVVRGWNSPEAAIDGSAKWIALNYVYGDYPQPTVYAMRWDYAQSNAVGGRGWHQYATSTTWPNSIPRLMSECYSYLGVNPTLYYVVPRFK